MYRIDKQNTGTKSDKEYSSWYELLLFHIIVFYLSRSCCMACIFIYIYIYMCVCVWLSLIGIIWHIISYCRLCIYCAIILHYIAYYIWLCCITHSTAVASHVLGYCSFGIMYHFGENHLSLLLAIIFNYYSISYDNTIHAIMDILYCIILFAILVHIQDYIILIWNIKGYQLLR